MKAVRQGHVINRYLDLFSLRLSCKRHNTNGRTDRCARQWFVLQHSGAFTKSHQAEFELWINKNKKHLEAYQRYEELWALLGSFSEKLEIHSTRLG